ncbi:MAG TPA: VCBS repeat-containing protein, partial [Pyrinomonadaceae bacterium]
MKKFLGNWKILLMPCLALLAGVGIIHHTGIGIYTVKADTTPQTLPFSQNWTNTGLITADDNWSGVPGIVGYRGDDLSTTIDVDLRTVVADGSATPIDVNANRTDPDTFTSGGIAEFEIANPVVAFQGSATADIPHIVIRLNTTGFSNIQLSYNARDIDAGAGIDAVQQINTQFRVGGTGNYANVTGGYIPDATSGVATATLVTPVSVMLPATADNQSIVEIRIMTTNALGSDEFVGIDDISVTGTPGTFTPADAPQDFNGDGKSDYVVVRNVGGGPSGQMRWFYNTNGTGAPTVALDWGLNGDFFMTEDFDGDGKDDITVWRTGAPTVAAFYILNSATNTARVEAFGQTGDTPKVIGDYDGDGKADPAVYRAGASAGLQSTWFYRGSLSNPSGNVTYVPWGQNGDFEAPGDYDGDGKNDFVVQRNNGGGQARFWRRFATGATDTVVFGTPTDVIVPGDYDGDGKTDLATVRGSGGTLLWHYLSSINGSINIFTFGLSATDFAAQGDYDGDGKTDIAVWRPDITPGQSNFYSRNSTNGATTFFQLGANGDYPVANWNQH